MRHRRDGEALGHDALKLKKNLVSCNFLYLFLKFGLLRRVIRPTSFAEKKLAAEKNVEVRHCRDGEALRYDALKEMMRLS